MRAGVLTAAIALAITACSGSPSVAGNTPSASASSSASPSASPSANPTVASYGLLLSLGPVDMHDPGQSRYLELITPSGTVAATVLVGPPSIHSCGPNIAAALQPPVSVTKDKVFFRSGNTKIRNLSLDGKQAVATTVPGSATKISFFSVSPDDKRIAVLVEDFSAPATIGLTLYVEDLKGGGHHRVIYTNKVAKSATATTLWPMGWHEGNLVLAVVPACSPEPASVAPTEWHVSSAATGLRIATIGKNHCAPSYWPSAAGVLCLDQTVDAGGLGLAYVYNWAGKIGTTWQIQKNLDYQSGVSPTAGRYFLAAKFGIDQTAPSTFILDVAFAGTMVAGHSACLWIDEDHLLAPDAVIEVKSTRQPAPPTPGPVSPTATPREEQVMTTSVTSLPTRASATCAGRFPGGL